jgi:hypothetical protein
MQIEISSWMLSLSWRIIMFLKAIDRAQIAIDILDENWEKLDDDIWNKLDNDTQNKLDRDWGKIDDAIYELNDCIAECREVFRNGVRTKKLFAKILDELWRTNPEIVDKFWEIEKFFNEYFSEEKEK